MKVSQQSVGYWISTATGRSHRTHEIDILYPAERTDLLPVVPSWNIFIAAARFAVIRNRSWKPVKSRFERLRITSKVHELSEQFDRRLSTVRVESGHVQIVDEEDLLSKQRWPVHVFAPFRQFFVDQILFIATTKPSLVSRFNESLRFFFFVLYILYIVYPYRLYDLSRTWVWFALVLAEKVIKSQINFFGMFLESFAVTVSVFPLPVGPTHSGFELLINR